MQKLLFLFGLFGVCLGFQVYQSHSDVITKPGAKVQIYCTHSITDYRVMLWYQRPSGDTAMNLIGFLLNEKDTIEESYKEHFNIVGDLRGDAAKNGSLVIPKAGLERTAVYFCAASWTGGVYPAYFGAGTKLTVLEHDVKEPKVEILGPSPKECRNEKDHEKKKTLLCVVSEFYPDHISVFWQVNENNVTSGVATDEIAQRDGKFYTMSSRLRVSAEDWFNPENEFKCIVIFFDGENYQRNESTINGEQSTVELNYRDKYLKATQKVKLSYTVFIIKSSIYGAFVAFLVWKLQRSTGK